MNKRLVSISALSYGSTGNIMQGICHQASQAGYKTKMFVSTKGKPLYVESDVNDINTPLNNTIGIFLNKITGFEGCFNFFSTVNLIKKIKSFSPDVIHLHILHHGYLNLPILFRFLKKTHIPVVWTLHDCWAFTGHCPHFSYQKCSKWQTGCCDCSRYKNYPKSLFDNSCFMWKWKKRWFSDLNNLTIVTPSVWLGSMLNKSYLSNYPNFVIHNGIDLDIFKPVVDDFRDKNDIGDKKMVLGVASVWSERKGLDVFIELSNRLPEEYKIVLVGTDDAIDKQLPDEIISIHRTSNQTQLAAIYTAADIFVNATREDTFPTVNLEALACGTPVVTFRTGGSPESIDETCGSVVDCDDVDSLFDEIIRICTTKPFSEADCINRARDFEQRERFENYVELYNEICSN